MFQWNNSELSVDIDHILLAVIFAVPPPLLYNTYARNRQTFTHTFMFKSYVMQYTQ